MEKDGEVGEGSYTTTYRSLDTRIGRWRSIDPQSQLYYSWSPYNLSLNNPVNYTDASGATVTIPVRINRPATKSEARSLRKSDIDISEGDLISKTEYIPYDPNSKPSLDFVDWRDEVRFNEVWKALDHIYENGDYGDQLNTPHPETGEVPANMGVVDARDVLIYLIGHEKEIRIKPLTSFQKSPALAKKYGGGEQTIQQNTIGTQIFQGSHANMSGLNDESPVFWGPWKGLMYPDGSRQAPVEILFHELVHWFNFLSDEKNTRERLEYYPAGSPEAEQWKTPEEKYIIQYYEQYFSRHGMNKDSNRNTHSGKGVKPFTSEGSTSSEKMEER